MQMISFFNQAHNIRSTPTGVPMSFDQMLSCPEDLRLMRTIGNQNPESVRRPVSRATINEGGRQGETFLIKAMPGEDLRICRVLFNAGADVNRAMITRYSPLTSQLSAQAGAD
jgi:hypothetical protein